MSRIKIPVELRLYKADVFRFVRLMMRKLFENRHKGKWSETDLRMLSLALRTELKELDDEIEAWESRHDWSHQEREGFVERISLEAADVANFALIIASVVHERHERISKLLKQSRRAQDEQRRRHKKQPLPGVAG